MLQAEEQLKEVNEGKRDSEQENTIRRMAKSLPEFPDTLIPAYILEKYPRAWQTHLERISDFLHHPASEESWWEYDGQNIVFLDSATHPDTRPEGPPLHHFRSSSIGPKKPTSRGVGLTSSTLIKVLVAQGK